MLVRPVDFNGMIQNTTEVSQIKTQEDNKTLVQQAAMQQTAAEHEMESTTQVHGNQETETENLQDDDSGAATYNGVPVKKRKKKEEKKKVDEGSIRKKGEPAPFDIKI